MKVTYNWLKDFVDIKISPQALADKLTMAGLEVTSLEEKEEDFVFEIEITSNRPDWLSVIGIAREVAAITNKKINVKSLMFNAKNIKHNTSNIKQLGVLIEDKKDCPLYIAKIIRDVKVAPSPDWLRKRLELIGCRSINNVVDITNYILFEYGEPLHAFDLDKIVRKFDSSKALSLGIIIRRAKVGEEITTIDGIKRILSQDVLVIASKDGEPTNLRTKELANNPIAIAGVMGGKDTEVTEGTKNILLEAAAFNPVVIRRGRQQLGIQSDSSYRFERGVNSSMVEISSRRAVKCIQDSCAGKCVLAKSSGEALQKTKVISFEIPQAQKILGLNIPGARIKQILSNLDFKVKVKSKHILSVEVPSHRQDVSSGVDLIEEVARIYGYENSPTTLPAVKPQVREETNRQLIASVKNILTGLGLNEVITYSLIDRGILNSLGIDSQKAIEIMNPLSSEQEILRPAITPGLIRCIAYNLNQKRDYVFIFEIAKSFIWAPAGPKEELVLGIGLCGIKPYLAEQGLIKERVSFLHLKGILEILFSRLGIEDYGFEAIDKPFEFGILLNKEIIGSMVQPQKNALEKLDIKNKDVFILEISLDRLMPQAQLKKKFIPWPKYPVIARDISFVLKDDVSIKQILDAAKDKGLSLLREVRVVDYYAGKQIPAGFRGMTISCLYGSDERTLTEEEINPMHSVVSGMLIERFGAKIR